jgi:Xaa-Pro dipeptidase
MEQFYAAHLAILVARYNTLFEQLGYETIVVSSGDLLGVELDDRTYPYAARAMAQQWVPFDIKPNTFIVLKPGQKPHFIWPAHLGFWHLSANEPSGEWVNGWTTEPHEDNTNWAALLTGRVAWIGPYSRSMPDNVALIEQEPAHAMQALAYYRVYKTEYEVAAMAMASELGAQGHLAAADAFQQGASEADIYRAFLAGSRQLESSEPYNGIVALNESAAVLHYERKLFEAPEKPLTLLIDAGAKVNGYASDITRTHTKGDSVFNDLLQAMEQVQLQIGRQVKPGLAMSDLHLQTEVAIAKVLNELKICKFGVEEQLAKGVTKTFFPHGLGHLLGLNVHDVGAEQSQPFAEPLRNTTSSRLRLTRKLEEGMVITIEPGVYFNRMLIDGYLKAQTSHGLDLDLIETLLPFGGIRIEDNIHITTNSGRNLTREAFSKLSQ